MAATVQARVRPSTRRMRNLRCVIDAFVAYDASRGWVSAEVNFRLCLKIDER